MLVTPIANKLYTIKTNASKQAISLVLYQNSDDSKLYPIIFSGYKLKAVELNYLVYKKEGLIIKEALR